MYIKINNTNYRKIKTLSFDPQTDVRGAELPINEFSAHIITSDSIAVGMMAKLYDDRNNLWANYWISFAEQIDEYTVSIIAQTKLVLLTRKKLPAVMYSNENVGVIISGLFSEMFGDYSIETTVLNKKITGFFPEQTAKERLQWICMVIGAYIKTCFTDRIEIKAIDTTAQNVGMNEVYWKPSVTYGDYITAVKVRAYSYIQGTPQTTDIWVTDGTDYYIQTVQDFTLINSDVPSGTPENVVEINDVTIINPNNVSEILSYLAVLYFKRTEVSASVINNRKYAAGDRIVIPLDEGYMVNGFIESCAFTFGLQAKSQIKVLQMDVVQGATLIMIYLYDGDEIGRKSYVLPLNYNYDIQNPYLDQVKDNRRIVYRPSTESTSGVVDTNPTYDEVNFEIALNYYKNKLMMISVDEVEQSGDTVEVT